MSSIEVLNAKMDQLTITQRATNQTLHGIDLAIRGDGRSTAGLAQRVAQLEQFQHEIKRLVRWAIFGVLGLFGNLIWGIVQAYLGQHP